MSTRINLILYVGGQAADLNDDALVQMNYTNTDFTEPAAVKNSYSLNVTLPGTPANDKIFGGMYRQDRRTQGGSDNVGTSFNPQLRTPFEIYDTRQRILERGYIKLNSVDYDTNGGHVYSVSLYGGIGEFFYTLAYDEAGGNLSLAGLPYFNVPNKKIEFTINAETVLEAWNFLNETGGIEPVNSVWFAINFIPCYNGTPEGDFDAGTAIAIPDEVGLIATQNKDDTSYTTKSGYTLVAFNKEPTEWDTKDMRSYLQRPGLSMQAFFLAVQRYAAMKGIAVKLDPEFFNAANPYYARAWMTLNMLSDIKMPVVETTHNLTAGQLLLLPDMYAEVTNSLENQLPSRMDFRYFNIRPYLYDVNPDVKVNTGTGGTIDLRLSNLYLAVKSDTDNNVRYWAAMVVWIEGLGPDYRVSAIGKPYIFTDPMMAESGEVIMEKCRNFHGDRDAFSMHFGNFRLEKYDGAKSVMKWNPADNVDPVVDMTGMNVMYRRVCIQWVNNTDESFKQVFYTYDYTPPIGGPSQRTGFFNFDILTLQGDKKTGGTSAGQYTMTTPEVSRSGSHITQDILLATELSPLDYLLSYTKAFGLMYIYDKEKNQVEIVTRNTFFKNLGSQENYTDLNDRLSLSDARTKKPTNDISKYLRFAWSDTEGAFATTYADKYGREYGDLRVDTGSNFDNDTNDAIGNMILRGACEVLERRPTFVNIERKKYGENTVLIPSVFIDGKNTYTLWNEEGDAEDFDVPYPVSSDIVSYMNDTYWGYDAVSKLQFHDADAGGTDGANVLVIYDGNANPDPDNGPYRYFRVTDDVTDMFLLNDNTPCWLLGSGGKKPVNMPAFRRILRDTEGRIELMLDFGTPAEIDIPGLSGGAGTALYDTRWKGYVSDLYHTDGATVTAKVNLRGLDAGPGLFRRLFAFENALWVLNKIKNYNLADPDLTECEFVKVTDTDNYTNGQKVPQITTKK